MDSREKDEELLWMLHLTDSGIMTCKVAGERFGLTKNAIIGLRDRIRKTAWIGDFCREPENIDGGMRQLWWKT